MDLGIREKTFKPQNNKHAKKTQDILQTAASVKPTDLSPCISPCLM